MKLEMIAYPFLR